MPVDFYLWAEGPQALNSTSEIKSNFAFKSRRRGNLRSTVDRLRMYNDKEFGIKAYYFFVLLNWLPMQDSVLRVAVMRRRVKAILRF